MMTFAYPGPTTELSEIVARDAFLGALNDRRLRARVLERDPPTFDDALKRAIRLEAIDKMSQTTNHRESHGLSQAELLPRL
jgi:hypothetical protein